MRKSDTKTFMQYFMQWSWWQFLREIKNCESNKICAMESLCININDEFVPQLVRFIPFSPQNTIKLENFIRTRL